MTSLGRQRSVIAAGGSVGGLFLGNLFIRAEWLDTWFPAQCRRHCATAPELIRDFILRKNGRPLRGAISKRAAPSLVH